MNVWIALVYDGHVHHDLVTDWFTGLDAEQARFCRFTQLGFFRLLTNERVMASEVKSQTEAWEIYDRVRQDRRVGFQEETPQVEAVLRTLTQGHRSHTNVWADAYLAAMGSCSGLTVATLDRGFSGFKGINVEVLAKPPLTAPH